MNSVISHSKSHRDAVKLQIAKHILILAAHHVSVDFTLRKIVFANQLRKAAFDIKKEFALIAIHHFNYKELHACLMGAEA